jgi:hypothetical protein
MTNAKAEGARVAIPVELKRPYVINLASHLAAPDRSEIPAAAANSLSGFRIDIQISPKPT